MCSYDWIGCISDMYGVMLFIDTGESKRFMLGILTFVLFFFISISVVNMPYQEAGMWGDKCK